jgi:RNA polymerase sigma-B factor
MAVRPGDMAAAGEVDGWFLDYAGSRDPALRERIILAYLGLADRLADRYRHSRGTTPEDLCQTARAGLIAAVDRYDRAAAPGLYRSRSPAWSASSNVICATPAGGCTSPGLSRNKPCGSARWSTSSSRPLGRAPTTSELAERLQVTEEQVLEALAVAHSRQELSLDRPVGDDTELCLGDLVAAPVAQEEAEDLLLLPRLVAALPEPDRTVIVLRFFADLTQDEIATRVGFSPMHVSRLLHRALGCLRAQLLDPLSSSVQ